VACQGLAIPGSRLETLFMDMSVVADLRQAITGDNETFGQ
jgi:hypothetical protein